MNDLLLASCRELVDCSQLAHSLGAAPAREQQKWACPRCGSSDALHLYQGAGRGGYCFSCGQGIDAIGLVRSLLGLGFREAVKVVAEEGGFADLVDREDALPPDNHRRKERRRQMRERVEGQRREREREREERHLRAMPIFREVWRRTWFRESGRRHLESRGLSLECQRHLGLTSVESRQEWEDICREVAEPAALEEAGLIGRGRDGETYPIPWAFPVLVIPYVGRGEAFDLDLIRFRSLAGPPARSGPKYLSPAGHRPTRPYSHQCIPMCDLHERIYICEGEIDCISIQEVGCPSIACPGAAVWQDEWAIELAFWSKVVVVQDGDEAGGRFGDRVCESLMRRRIPHERLILEDGMDANDHLVDGTLKGVLDV